MIPISNYLIGKNAVSAIEKETLESKYLLPEIPVGDTYPSWDGEILVYSSEDSRNQRSKSNMKGRVPVQVKGKYVDEFSEKERRYPIEVIDLINYSNDSGALFFLVEMKKMTDPDETKIFYAELLVSDIQSLIDGKENQKTINHTFQELPKERINTICNHFLHHRHRQGYKLIKYDEKVDYSEYIFTIIGKEEEDLDFHLFNAGTYIYGVDKQRNIEVPITKFKADAKIEQVEFNIGTEEKVYYKCLYRETSINNVVIRFGKSFTLTFSENRRFNINFSEKGSIRERIDDCDFLLNIAKFNKMFLNQNEITLNFTDYQRKEIIEILPGYINKLKEILNVFNKLGVEPEVDFDKLKKQGNQIKLLIDIAKEQVPDSIVAMHKQFLKVNVGDYNFLFAKGTTGKNKAIFNLFDYEKLNENLRVVVGLNETLENLVEHSPFIFLEPSELFTFDNLNMQSIEKSLINIDYSEEVAKSATNTFLLKTLHYIDNTKNTKKQDILTMVTQVFDCIMKSDFSTVYIINKMQTILRTRSLTDDEIGKLMELKNKHIKDNFTMCAFDILLENYKEFSYHFNQMSKEERISFVRFPIYNLIKGKT